jgi:hypothetical protein
LGPLKNEIPPQVRKADQRLIRRRRNRALVWPQGRGGGKCDQLEASEE